MIQSYVDLWSGEVIILGDDAEFYMEMQEEERRYEQMLKNSYYYEEYEEEAFNALYLVDGDNHVYEGLDGIDDIGAFGKVQVFVSQEGLRDNLLKRYRGIDIIMVTPGENAVDNRIKGILGNRIRQRKSYQKIYVISHDKGYKKLVDKYRIKYNLSPGYLSLRKSIRDCR